MLFAIYKRFLSSFIHMLSAICYSPSAGCRFYPTCSAYYHQAVTKYGIIHGSILGLKRLLRCHPYSHSPHIDPIP